MIIVDETGRTRSTTLLAATCRYWRAL